MPCKELSDVACLEWARFGETRISTAPSAEVAAHLQVCADCRRKVAAFEEMERKVHPYGGPAPVDRRRVWFRRCRAAVILGALAYACWLILF